MIRKKSTSVILFFLLFPYKVDSELSGFILDSIWGPSAPLPEILKINPMINMTTEEVIRYYGYHCEKHEVITDDGYILELHRIVNKNITATNSSQREPILIVPGILADSGYLIAYNETHSPGFFFTNAGYDVWLHNNRGTRYSRKHQTLKANTDNKFFNYSFHEMGVYDLPATVDYILQTTNKPQIYLTGHSMGGTVIAIFLSEKQSYKEKIRAAFLWAPAVYLPGSLPRLARSGLLQIMDFLLSLFDEMEVLPYTNNNMLLISHLYSGPLFSRLYQLSLFILTQDYQKAFEENEEEMIFHRDFSQYDYGPKGNMIAYNQTTPPSYNLQNIKQPVYIYYCESDGIVTSSDVREVSSNFTNLKALIRIPDLTFSHTDFTLSPNAKKYIYDSMLKAMSMPQDQLQEIENMTTNTPITTMTTSSPITTTTTNTPITTMTQSTPITTTTTRTPITTTTTSISIKHFDNSDYFYSFLPMTVLIFVLIFLFIKFIQQQLSETKTKYRQTKIKENF